MPGGHPSLASPSCLPYLLSPPLPPASSVSRPPNAGHGHGVSLRETWCTCVPLLAPGFPLLPRSPVPRAHLLFFPFLVASLVAFIAAHTRPACAPCSSLPYLRLTAPYPHPLSRLFSPPHLLSAVTRTLTAAVLYPCALHLFPISLAFRDAMGSW